MPLPEDKLSEVLLSLDLGLKSFVGCASWLEDLDLLNVENPTACLSGLGSLVSITALSPSCAMVVGNCYQEVSEVCIYGVRYVNWKTTIRLLKKENWKLRPKL